MTTEERIACNGIIHSASMATAGGGAGLTQISCSDNLIISPIQLAMTISLGKVFGIDLDQSIAKSTLASAAATTIGRAATQLIVGWIPIAGNIINAVTAATLTETIGWIMADEFAKKKAFVS